MGFVQDRIDEITWEKIKELAEKYDDEIFGPDMHCERKEGFDKFMEEIRIYLTGV